MDKDNLITRLIVEFGYPPKGAALLAEKIFALSADMFEIFSIWWENGIVPNVEVEGYTVERLAHEHGMNTIAALLTLDFLRCEPNRALESLRKGHDRVDFGR